MNSGLKSIILPSLVIVVLFFTMMSGFLVPIYSDEFAIHQSLARFFYNDLSIVGLFPQCDSAWIREARWYEYPALIIYSILYPSANPFFLRLSGISFALVNLCLLWFLCGKLVKNRTLAFNIYAFILAVISLGVLPYVMILTRSEQVLVMCLILFFILSIFYPLRLADSQRINFFKCILFLLIVTVFYFSHPKAIFFVPCVFACIYFYTYAGSIGLRVSTLIVFIVITFKVVFSAKNATQCMESPVVTQVLAEHVNNFATWDLSFFAFVTRMSSHIQMGLERLSSRFLFQTNYQSEWLPGVLGEQLNSISIVLNWIFKNFIIYFVWFIVGFVVLMMMRQFLRGEDVKRHVFAIGMLCAIFLNAAVYSLDAWSFYTPSLIIPVLLLALLLVIPDFLVIMQNRLQYIYLLAVPFYLLAIISMFNLVKTTFPQLYASVQNGELIVPHQKISTPIALSSESFSVLNSLVQQCGIPMSGANRAVVDGVAYGFLQNMHQPINILYVNPFGYGKDIKDLGEFLSAKSSDGILSRCEYLPPSLLQRAIEINGMCCVSQRALIK